MTLAESFERLLGGKKDITIIWGVPETVTKEGLEKFEKECRELSLDE